MCELTYPAEINTLGKLIDHGLGAFVQGPTCLTARRPDGRAIELARLAGHLGRNWGFIDRRLNEIRIARRLGECNPQLLFREKMMASRKEQQASAEARARQSLEAAKREEALKAMLRAEADETEARTRQLRALRMAKDSSKG